jgi:hypothetical protein
MECGGCGKTLYVVVPAFRSWKDELTCPKCPFRGTFGRTQLAPRGITGGYEIVSYWNRKGVCVEAGVPGHGVSVGPVTEVGERDPDAYLRKQLDDNLRGLFT